MNFPSITLLSFLSSFLILGQNTQAQSISPEKSPTAQSAHDAKMQWFRDAHFGIFIHWGLYSHYAGIWNEKPALMANGCAEWMMLVAKAPRKEYAEGAKNFNPKNFNADSWVKSIKNAGAKYIIITSKHHEGFAMFPSKASKFNIFDATPFGRDPLKELAQACKKHDIRLGFYYSQNLDWYHQGGGSGDWDPTHKGSPDDYVDKIAIPQIKEILTQYGEISVLWYDIPHGGIMNEARAKRIKATVDQVAPNIITNNRLGGNIPGDIQTPENTIPATGIPGKDWETCLTMNKTWGFYAGDTNWKSSDKLIQTLCDATSKGGNLLLNIGPDGLGNIPEASLKRLGEMGNWLRDYGAAIYGTRASIFANLPSWGRWTTRAGNEKSTLYAIVFQSPKSEEILLPGLQNKILRAYELKEQIPAEIISPTKPPKIKLPTQVLGKNNFVIAIEIEGKPLIDKAIYPDASGKLKLLPILANCQGNIRRKEFTMSGLSAAPEECLENWTGKSDCATWQITLEKPQTFTVSMRYSAIKEAKDREITLSFNPNQKLEFSIVPTGNWKKFATSDLGEISLPAGTHTITLSAKNPTGAPPCNPGIITLTPKN